MFGGWFRRFSGLPEHIHSFFKYPFCTLQDGFVCLGYFFFISILMCVDFIIDIGRL